jgi:hypothetical protein
LCEIKTSSSSNSDWKTTVPLFAFVDNSTIIPKSFPPTCIVKTSSWLGVVNGFMIDVSSVDECG